MASSTRSIVAVALLGPFLICAATAYCGQTVNALGLQGDLGRALGVGAGVYLVTVEKVAGASTSPLAGVSGTVRLRVDAAYCGRAAKDLLLPFSTPEELAKTNGDAVWPKVPRPQDRWLVVVVPNGSDGNIRPPLPDGAASEAWPVTGADDPQVKWIKQALALWTEKDLDAQIKACETALASSDPALRQLAVSVLCQKDLDEKPKETLQVLEREKESIKAGKAKLGFNAAVVLFASLERLANTPKAEQESKDAALRILAGFVLLPDPQLSAWAIGFLATAVERGTAKASATDLLEKDQAEALRSVVVRDLKPGADVPARAAAEKIAKWAGVAADR
jgi:hypothetical protein